MERGGEGGVVGGEGRRKLGQLGPASVMTGTAAAYSSSSGQTQTMRRWRAEYFFSHHGELETSKLQQFFSPLALL